MTWKIEVDLGVGPLKFGMRPDEVGSRLNSYKDVEIRSQEMDGSVFEYRSHDMPICYYKNDLLWHISLRSGIRAASIEGIDLFAEDSKSVLLKLLTLSGEVRVFEEMIIFHSLGITTRGYLDPASGQYTDVRTNRDARAIGVSEVETLRTTLQDHKAFLLP